MPITARHVFTSPIADGTNTQIVRPSDWNSGHLITFQPSGGELIGAFSNSGNVSFGTNTAGYITAAAPAGGGVALSAGTNSTSTGTVVFSNSNGLTFGMNTNGVVTGSYTVPTDYLTTAALSNHSHAFATTTTNGASIIVGTTNSNGVTIGVPDYLTTAALSNHSHGNPTLALTNLSGTTASASNGFTLSLSAGNYLTTARASTDAVGLNTAGSNVTWTVNSSGLSLDARGYAGTGTTFNGTNINGSLTQNSNGLRLDLSVNPGGAADGYNSAQFTNSTANSTMAILWAGNSNGSGNITLGLTGSTVTGSAPSGGAGAAISAGANSQNTGTVIFSNSNGVSFGLNAGTLTASHNGLTQQSTQPVAYSAANGSANFSTLTFANSNGVSFSTGTQGLYATVRTDYQSSNANYLTSQSNQALSAANGSFTFQTATFANSNGVSFSTGTQGLYATVKTDYLTTARASTDAIGLNTAATNVTWTVNSSGLSLNAAGYAGTGSTFNGTNISGSMTLNSNGLRLDLSGAGGGTINQTGPNIAAAGVTVTNGTVVFSNSNGVSFGLNGSTMTASVNAGGAATLSYFDNVEAVAAGATVGMSSRVSQASTIWLFPINRDGFPGNMTVQTAQFNVFNSGNTNSISAALTYTWGLGIYQVTDATRLTLLRKASSVWTQSANANYSQSLVGQRWLTFHSTQFSNATGGASVLELAEGGRYVGALSVSSAGSAIQTHNFIGEYMYSTNARSGHMGVLSATGTSKGFYPWLGQFSATSSAFPDSIGYNQINKQVASGNFRPQLIFNNLGDLG